MQIEIRPVDADSEAAKRLIADLDEYLLGLYPPESNHLDSVAELSRAHVRFFGAFCDRQLLGCGAVKLMRSGYAEIKRIYVDDAARGLGLARELLRALENCARTEGYDIVRLETGVRQPEALKLFECNGYTRTGPFGSYPDDPLSIFMRKQI